MPKITQSAVTRWLEVHNERGAAATDVRLRYETTTGKQGHIQVAQTLAPGQAAYLPLAAMKLKLLKVELLADGQALALDASAALAASGYFRWLRLVLCANGGAGGIVRGTGPRVEDCDVRVYPC
jgi:hypothetical protein